MQTYKYFRLTAAVFIFIICVSLSCAAETTQQVTDNFAPVDQSIKIFEARVLESPKDFVSWNILSQLYAQKARDNLDPALYEVALEKAEKARSLDKTFEPAILQQASVLIALHEFEKARALIEPLVKAGETDPPENFTLFDADFELGRYDEARVLLSKLLSIHPEEPPVLARQAKLRELFGDLIGAEKSIGKAEAVIRREGDFQRELIWYLVRQGELEFRRGQLDTAEKFYQKALRIWPDSPLALQRMAELRGAQGNFAEAVERYSDLLLHNATPQLQQAKAELLIFFNKREEAQPYLSAARDGYERSISQGRIYYLHHLAAYYSDLEEQPKKALEFAERDFNDRQSGFARDGLAWAYYKNGDYDKAVETIEPALKLGIKDTHLLYHAGLILNAAGRFQEGQKLIQGVMKINPRYNTFHEHR